MYFDSEAKQNEKGQKMQNLFENLVKVIIQSEIPQKSKSSQSSEELTKLQLKVQ